MNWFQSIFFLFTWRNVYVQFEANNSESALTKTQFSRVFVRNIKEEKQYFLTLVSTNSQGAIQNIEVQKTDFYPKIKTQFIKWTKPKELKTGLYQLKCSDTSQLSFTSDEFLISNFSFDILKGSKIQMEEGTNWEWPFSEPIDINFKFDCDSKHWSTSSDVYIEAKIFKKSKFLGLFPRKVSIIKEKIEGDQVDLQLTLSQKKMLFGKSDFVWEFWLVFDGNREFIFHRVGPFTPVLTIGTLKHSKLYSFPWILISWMFLWKDPKKTKERA